MDIVITGVFFILISILLRPHVPLESFFWVTLWASFSAVPIAGTFFLASQMFRVVLTDQRRRPSTTES